MRLLSNPRAVFFDLDGTLADTAEDLAAPINAMRVARGLAPMPVADIRPFASAGARGLIGKGLDVGKDDPGYEALRHSSQPLHVALEHDGHRPYAIWVFNDTPYSYPNHVIGWKVFGASENILLEGETSFDVGANTTQRVIETAWRLSAAACVRVDLELRDANRNVVSTNTYRWPFQPLRRPRGARATWR